MDCILDCLGLAWPFSSSAPSSRYGYQPVSKGVKSGPKRKPPKQDRDDGSSEGMEGRDKKHRIIHESQEKKPEQKQDSAPFYWMALPLAATADLPKALFPALAEAVHKHGPGVFQKSVIDSLVQQFQLKSKSEFCSFLVALFTKYIWDEHATTYKLVHQTWLPTPEESVYDAEGDLGTAFDVSEWKMPAQHSAEEKALKRSLTVLMDDIFEAQQKILLDDDLNSGNHDDPFLWKSNSEYEFTSDEEWYEHKRKRLLAAHFTVLILLTPDMEYLASVFLWPSLRDPTELCMERISSSIHNLLSRKHRHVAFMVFSAVTQWARELKMEHIAVFEPYAHIKYILKHMECGYDQDGLLCQVNLIDLHLQEELRQRKIQLKRYPASLCRLPWEGQTIKQLASVFDHSDIVDDDAPNEYDHKSVVRDEVLAMLGKRYPYYYYGDPDSKERFPIPTSEIMSWTEPSLFPIHLRPNPEAIRRYIVKKPFYRMARLAV